MTSLRTLFLPLLLSACAFSQTAVFPGAIVTDSQLKTAVNLKQTTLLANMAAGDSVAVVASSAGFVANMLVTVDSEIMSITSILGNVLTVTRGFDGTAAAAHSASSATCSGTTPRGCVKGYVVAWHHNAVSKELEATQTALGVNLANVVKTTLPITFGPTTGTGIPGHNNPYVTPNTFIVRDGTVASPQSATSSSGDFQRVSSNSTGISQAFGFDCSSTSAARYGFSGGCITLSNVIHDQTVARGGVANRNTVYADAPPAVSALTSAVNSAGTVTVTTGSAHYAATGESVVIAGSSGMTGLNALVASVTVTSPTTFTFSCGGCGAGPGAGGTVTIPTAYYASWDSVFKVSGPQLRIVGHESDMNNQYGDAGDNVGAQDATFNYALYCSSHNCTTGMYIDSGDSAGKYYFPLKFGANAVATNYPYIDTSANNNGYAADFAWIGNSQFIRWLDTTGGRWPLMGLDTNNNLRMSAPTGQGIYMGPNLTTVFGVDASGIILAKAIQPRELWNDTSTSNSNQHYGRVVYDSGTNIPLGGGGWVFQDVNDSVAFTKNLLFVTKKGILQIGAVLAYASLPACGATVEGSYASLSDSNTNTWGATVAGGGANHILTYCDGTNWTVAGK